MDNAFSLFSDIDKDELSAEDLAVLKAFEAMESQALPPLKPATAHASDSVETEASTDWTSAISDDMLAIFVAEAQEDLVSMQHMLENLEQSNHADPHYLTHLKQLGHKLYGTAGAVDFPVMSIIASHVEAIAQQIGEENIYPLAGLYILAQAITALECDLNSIRYNGKEPIDAVLLEPLNEIYKNLNIDLHL